MTRPTETGSDTLLAPQTDERPVAAPPVEPTLPPNRWFWPLTAVVVAAVVLFSGWALMQLRTVEDVAGTPRVHSDHDGSIELQVRERAGATAPQLDPWVQRELRARGAVVDPWVQRELRAQAPAADGHLDPWVRNELRNRAGAEVPLDPWIRNALRDHDA